MNDDLRLRLLLALANWRATVASERGPASPVTRHVLLTVSLHTIEGGDSRFPSQVRLAVETGLALRTVKQHIAAAVAAGWISKLGRRRPNGQGWKQVEYTLTIPPAIEARFHVKQRSAFDDRQGAESRL